MSDIALILIKRFYAWPWIWSYLMTSLPVQKMAANTLWTRMAPVYRTDCQLPARTCLLQTLTSANLSNVLLCGLDPTTSSDYFSFPLYWLLLHSFYISFLYFSLRIFFHPLVYHVNTRPSSWKASRRQILHYPHTYRQTNTNTFQIFLIKE